MKVFKKKKPKRGVWAFSVIQDINETKFLPDWSNKSRRA
jgi:hypothetical protein